MKVYSFDLKNIPEITDKLNLCLGFFDGVHIGHQTLIKKAQTLPGKSAVLSFEIAPRPGKHNKVITTVKDKINILENLGLDYLLLLKVDQELMDTTYDNFIKLCLNKLNINSLVMGSDFTFGKDAKGTPEILKNHFNCEILNLKEVHHKKVASRDIKSLIEEGKIEEANELLGRPFMISNPHQKGFGKGRDLGFNTLNVAIGSNYVCPKYGVYLTNNYVNGRWIYGLTNVGIHPTLNMLNEPIIEAHLLNYSTYEEIKEDVSVKFIKFIRPEKHFKTVKDLQNQVFSDIKDIKKYLNMK